MAKRGRPPLSDEQKAENKAKKDASKAVNDWDARLPAEPERRVELLAGLRRKEERLREETKAIRDEIHVAGEVKTLTTVYGLRKAAINVKRIFDKLPSAEEVTAVWRQVQMMASDHKWDSAPGLFDVATVGKAAAENGSIFDKTASGERTAAERGDDPGRARRRTGKSNPPVPPRDTGRLSESDAVAAFEAANAAKAARTGAGEDDEVDLRPPFMRQPSGEPDGLESAAQPQSPLAGAEGGGSYKIVHH